MALCGGNGMGFLNLERGCARSGSRAEGDAPGAVTFISHSGSAFAALAFNDRRTWLQPGRLGRPGDRHTMADYLAYALGLESTRWSALFLETVRDPERFRAALARRARARRPGRRAEGRAAEAREEMVAAHSGALAGEDGAYEALFDAYGVLAGRDLDEMVDTLALFMPAARGPGRARERPRLRRRAGDARRLARRAACRSRRSPRRRARRSRTRSTRAWSP